MVGKSKNRKRTAEGFHDFPQLLRLLIKVNRKASLQRQGIKTVMFLLIAAGQFCLLSYWMTVGIWAIRSGFLYTLRIAQRLSNSFWAFPSGFPIPFYQCQAAVKQPLGAFQATIN
jgi:hypothetical protein